MSKSMEKKQEAQLARRESFIEKGDVTGTENITADDLRLPRLSFAQGLSEQLIQGSSLYIPNLKMFEMFNDLSAEIYGNGPLEFVPVRRDVRYIEFRPRSEGGGVVDLDVPANDPRTRWTTEGGERMPPRATRFVEFVILLLKEDNAPEAIVLSIKDTNKWNRRASERLTGFIKLKQKPIYAGVYSIASKVEKNDSGTFAVPVIQPVAMLDDQNVDDETWDKNKIIFAFAKSFELELRGKTITTDREHPEDDAARDESPIDRPEM